MDKKEARRESRVIATQAFFFYLSREMSVPLKECFDEVLGSVYEKGEDEMAWNILSLAEEHFQKMKLVVRAFAPDFPFEKIAPINRVLLILGLVEMKYVGTPPVVVINEYIEVAKSFGEEKSAPFVNGVLDAYRKELKLEGSKKEEVVSE